MAGRIFKALLGGIFILGGVIMAIIYFYIRLVENYPIDSSMVIAIGLSLGIGYILIDSAREIW